MAKALRDDLVWQDVDVDTLKGPVKKAYDAYKAATAASRDAREAFEASFRKGAAAKFDSGMSCLFSHKFGKLSIAQVPENEVTNGAKKAKAEKFAL